MKQSYIIILVILLLPLSQQSGDCNVQCAPNRCYQNMPDRCTVCRSEDDENRRSTRFGCGCVDQYFDDLDNGPQCQPCESKCNLCAVKANQCVECVDKYTRLQQNDHVKSCFDCVANASKGLDGMCKCNDNCWTQNYECFSCGECKTCHPTDGCTECKEGYYILNKSCVKCTDNCEICENQNGCTSCLKKFFISGTTPNITCPKCDDKCSTCEITKDNCTECSDPNKKPSSCTECKDTYYLPSQGGNCLKCQYPCDKCTQSKCLSCKEPSRRSTIDTCQCKNEYFTNSQKQCLECQYPCQTCSKGVNKCDSCVNTQFRISSTNCNCQDNYFDDKSKCVQCGFKCATCYQSANICTKCTDYHTGLNSCNNCVNNASKNLLLKCECNKGSYSVDTWGVKSCELCLVKCGTCENNKSNCTSCASDRVSFSINNDCICKSGTFDPGNNQKCQSCVYPCSTCSSLTYCDSCQSPLNRIKNSSSCGCEPGYYETGTNCAKCGKFCLTCVDFADKCLSCKQFREYAPSCQFCVKGTYESDGDCLIETVVVHNAIGSEKQKKSRCMDVSIINRVQNCKMCRANKDSQGKIISLGSTSEGIGTFSLRNNLGVFTCNQESNEKEGLDNPYDQELRVPFCEIYDNYGLCRRCLVRYGLQWVYEDSNQNGYYRCIENENNVPFCHEYDSNGICIKCKWNQNDDEQNLYKNDQQEYQLDYALYLFNGKQFCINNVQHDMIIRHLNNNFKQEYQRSNCAEYDSNYNCVRCHTRKYDYEGNVQWNFDKEVNKYESKDYILSKKEKGHCVSYPLSYITKPELLIQLGENINSQESKCGEGYKIYRSESSLEYGCGTTIQNCIRAQFNWDYEGFQKTGLWYKKFLKCIKCDNNMITDGDKCVQATQGLSGCEIIDSQSQCTQCSSQYYLVKSQKNKCILKTSITFVGIFNCIQGKYEFIQDQDNNILVMCTQCDFGYVPTNDGKCSFVQDQDNRGCSQKNENKVGSCISSQSKYGWLSSGLCEHGIVRNIEQLCYSSTGLRVIENCKIYINTDKESKCHECDKEYILSDSMDTCLKKPSNEAEKDGIEKCIMMDGPWCQKCQRDIEQEDGTFIHYILTNQNTCVLNNIQNNQNCIYALYNDNSYYRKLSTCLQCENCYQLNSVGICEEDIKCKNQNSKIYLLSDIETLVEGDNVENCYIHRDIYGNCYECDRINEINYGIYTNPQNQKKECQQCKSGQILEKSVNGEYICVTPVAKCIQYHENDFCVSCDKNHYLKISDSGSEIYCTSQCDSNKQVYDLNSKQDICLTDNKDQNCETIGLYTQYYEFYQKDNNQIGLRCTICEDNYLIDVSQSNQCLNGNSFYKSNLDFKYSRIFQNINSESPKVYIQQDRFMTYGPCINSSGLASYNYIFIESLGYCVRYSSLIQQEFIIQNCQRQNNQTGDQTICVQCMEGYYLNQDKTKCLQVFSSPFQNTSTTSENCLYQESNNNYCTKCRYGYIKSHTSCVKQDTFACLSQNISSCQKCQKPFIRVRTGVLNNYTCVLKIDGCLLQTQNDKCDYCLQGYQYDSVSGKCLRRTENYYDQDFSISYDYIETQTMRGDVCKGCYQSEDKIRLYYINDNSKQGKQKLVRSCVYGCQQLKRQMNVRSPSHLFNVWSCYSCRINEYHINTTIDTQQCVKADKIPNCQLFQEQLDNFQEVCKVCASNYYINNQGKQCTLCEGLVNNCELQDELATSLTQDKLCKCKKCNEGFFITGSGECKKFEQLNNCLRSNTQGKCIQCNNNSFLDSEEKCQNYSQNLNCGNISNYNKLANSCIKCDQNSNFQLLNTEGKCVQGTINNCIVYQDSETCIQCKIGYGLDYSRQTCIDNSLSKRQKNCYRYNNQIFNDFYVCYECNRGYALDYNLFNYESEQCVKISYCQKAYKDSSGTYCQECKLTDYQDEDSTQEMLTVFRTQIPSKKQGICHLENNKFTSLVQNCKYYQSFTDSNRLCFKCHDGYNSDKNGTKCVSDYHPGALPGCYIYQTFNYLNDYQKYEDLVCHKCHLYYKFSQDTEIVKFSLNTYSSFCDQIEIKEITLPGKNVWNGKDGGLRNQNQNNDDDNGDGLPDLNDDSREFYEDPQIQESQILKFLLLKIILIIVLM